MSDSITAVIQKYARAGVLVQGVLKRRGQYVNDRATAERAAKEFCPNDPYVESHDFGNTDTQYGVWLMNLPQEEWEDIEDEGYAVIEEGEFTFEVEAP